jgi:hypothetical protein
MPGIDSGIHLLSMSWAKLDPRVKPADDDGVGPYHFWQARMPSLRLDFTGGLANLDTRKTL